MGEERWTDDIFALLSWHNNLVLRILWVLRELMVHWNYLLNEIRFMCWCTLAMFSQREKEERNLFDYLRYKILVVFEGFRGEDECEREFTVTPCILSWESDGGLKKGPLMLNVLTSLYLYSEDDKYKLIETLSMSGPFSGPPSLSQERIHGVTPNPLLHIRFLLILFNFNNIQADIQHI